MRFYDGEEGPVPIFDLPMPTLEQLAQHDDPPSAEIRAEIVRAAAKHNGNPYWTHAEVHQTYGDVTIGQVAIVLLNSPAN